MTDLDQLLREYRAAPRNQARQHRATENRRRVHEMLRAEVQARRSAPRRTFGERVAETLRRWVGGGVHA